MKFSHVFTNATICELGQYSALEQQSGRVI